LTKFFDSRGEQKIEVTPWREAATDEESKYDGQTIKEVRELNVEVQVKGNPFVKSSPTIKNFKIIERTPTKIHMRVLNRVHSVPYCDCFGVEEDWWV